MMIGIGTPSSQSKIPRPITASLLNCPQLNGLATVWFQRY
jgi:hypothetical protein